MINVNIFFFVFNKDLEVYLKLGFFYFLVIVKGGEGSDFLKEI